LDLPKPLLPFLGPPVLDLALWKFVEAGFSTCDLAVNTHHLGSHIIHHLQQHPLFSGVHISSEKEILGTGGAMNALHDWLGDADLIIYNGDILSDIDIDAVIRHHENRDALATMVLLPELLPQKNAVYLDSDTIMGIGSDMQGNSTKYQAHTFTGVHILSNKFVQSMVPRHGYWHITDIYRSLLRDGQHLAGYLHHGFWSDIGTPRDYYETSMHFLTRMSGNKAPDIGLQRLLAALNLPYTFVAGQNADYPNIEGPVFIMGAQISSARRVGPLAILLFSGDLATGAATGSSILMQDADVRAYETVEREIRMKDKVVKIDGA
jgi:NDP-sugar pyrophosphorylase family protein